MTKFMKKSVKGIVSAVLCATMIGGSVIVTGCKSKATAKRTYDNENDPLVLASDPVDRVFNPFFSTTGADGSVVGMTQLGMLGNDADGTYTWGDDEEVITKDLGVMYDEKNDTTTYYFVLKNDIKFSNGSALTIKDVLFNYYVYLDPSYTGSSTIYSTDIVGLKAYRTQSNDEKEQENFGTAFETSATKRVTNLTKAYYDICDLIEAKGDTVDGYDIDDFRDLLSKYKTEHPSDDYKYVVDDFDRIVGTAKGGARENSLFWDELESDYNSYMGSYSTFELTDEKGNKVTKDKDGRSVKFTTDAQVFLYNYGKITWNRKTLELKVNVGLYDTLADVAKITREQALKYVFDDYVPGQLDQVINYSASANKLYQVLVNSAMEEYFKDTSSSKAVKNISGIKFANKDGAVTFTNKKTVTRSDGKTMVKDDKEVTYPKAEYDADGNVTNNEVLSITINGVDPKAIWNFGIGVAPMYYYSDADHIAKFEYEENFGVEFASQTFYSNVVNSPSKIGLPVGAGAYMASKASGGSATGGSQFYDNGVIYYERNPYYNLGKATTTDADGNTVPFTKVASDGKEYKVAKIKKVRYKVATAARMLDDLYSGSIDYATPNATVKMRDSVDNKSGFDEKVVRTSGYGYIGINAGKISSVYVRRAIMYAVDVADGLKSYYGTMADPIYRPMSKESWAYPTGAVSYYPYIGGAVPAGVNDNTYSDGKFDQDYRDFIVKKGISDGQKLTQAQQIEFIQTLLRKDGFAPGSDGIYRRSKDGRSEVLKYTFTIAGESQDHPGWNMLMNAATLLNKCGFNVEVRTNANALSALATGGLTVWAAAWGSTIDPDMYQVYHKDSKATSVYNWGYPQIKAGRSTSLYRNQWEIVNNLSTVIEQARETEDVEIRKARYSEALDYVMELAVELPTYQRNDLFAYNSTKIDASTFTKKTSAYKGLISDLTSLSLKIK